MKTKRFLLMVGVSLSAISLAVGSANADPTGTPTFRVLAGVGSDTTQGVLNGLSNVVVDGTGTKLLGSYDAVGSAQITTKDPATSPACTINRPANSGDGVTALVNSQTAGNGCLQFARSSANNSSSFTGANLTYIPFAVDAVTYAVRSDGPLSLRLTTAQLTQVYNCQVPAYAPLLPNFGSGTRKFFLQQLGFTDSSTFTTSPGHTCIQQVDATGAGIEENTGTALTAPNQIIPYSIAQYLSQTAQVVADVRGKAVLGNLNGIAPGQLNTDSSFTRSVYNVVPTGQLGNAPYSTVFVGPTSQICQNTATIKAYGFGVSANCGDTSLHTN